MNKLIADANEPALWHRDCIIRLNGAAVKDVVRADEVTGEVRCYVQDGRGRLRLTPTGDEFLMQTLRGNVEISLRPDAGQWAWAAFWLDRLGNPHETDPRWLP